MFDWFTFCAQVVNFIILVWLLKRFLFTPVIAAMDARKAEITRLFEKSQEKIREAEEAKHKLEQQLNELEQIRDEKLQESQAFAEAHKAKLLKEIKAEVKSCEERWKDVLASEIDSIGEEFKLKVHHEVMNIVRRVITDLADQRLEEHILDRCIEELFETQMPKGGNGNQPHGANSITIRTRWNIEDNKKERIRTLLEDRIGKIKNVDFETKDDLIAGLEIIVNNHKAVWNVDKYLEGLDQRIKEEFHHGRS